MEFINLINKTAERIPEQLINLRCSELPLCLYGNSKGAEYVYDKLSKYGIKFNKVLVGKEYYKENTVFRDIEVSTMDIYGEKVNSYNIFVGFDIEKYKDILKEIIKNTKVEKVFMFSAFSLNLSYEFRKKIYSNKKILVIDRYYEGLIKRNLDYKYLLDNLENFKYTYDLLEDKLSRDTFIAYLKGHINVSSLPMEKVFVDNQYFCRDIIKLEDDEVFVDCGGYTGDTIESFIINATGQYKKIYVFEPDPKILVQLKQNIKDLDNIVVFNKGAYDMEGKVQFFNEKTGSSSIGNIFEFNEQTQIEVGKIDSLIDDKVTMIKMDIEGAELKALEGAKNIIKRDRPKLAICVYHKKEDLITIPQYINSIADGYKFYLRAHMEIASEVVLYAVKG